MTKTIHSIGKTDLLYNSMELCGNFTHPTVLVYTKIAPKDDFNSLLTAKIKIFSRVNPARVARRLMLRNRSPVLLLAIIP